MSNRFMRWTLGGIFLGLAVFLVNVVRVQVSHNAPPPPVIAPILDEADAGMEGFVYRQTKDGRVQWEVAAQKAKVFEAKHEAVLDKVQLRFFGQDGEAVVLEADEGMINTETHDFELRNRDELMTIEFANGYTILTPHIHWIDSKQEIRTPHSVTIQGNGLTITGTGFLGNIESEEFTLLDQVHVEISS